MESGKLNIYVVDDDEALNFLLRNFLRRHFGNNIAIQTFIKGEQCLDEMNENVDLVLLDFFLEDGNGMEVLESIKLMSPSTEVVMFSGNEEIGPVIEAFRTGAKDYIVKDANAFIKIAYHIHKMLTEPISLFAREISQPKYIA